MLRAGAIFTACLLIAGATLAQIPKLEYGLNFAGDVRFVDTDLSGNTFLTGTFYQTVTFGTTDLTPAGDQDVFIVKVDGSGVVLWAKSFGGPSFDDVKGLDIDPSGNVLLVGTFIQTVDFDPGIGTDNRSSDSDSGDGYVLKLDNDGDFLWVGQIGGPGDDIISAVATDNSSVYITGSFSDIADLDPGPASVTRTATATDAFFIKLNDDGTLNWLKTAGNGNYAQGLGVAVDFTSTPVFTGNYSGALDIDLGPPVVTLDDHSGFDIFIVKLENSNGAFRWGGGFGADGGGNYIRSISIDGQNNIYLAGGYYGAGDFDPTAAEFNLSSTGEADAFVSKFHPSGALLWASSVGGDLGSDYANSVYSGSAGLYVTGSFFQKADFNPSQSAVNYLTSRGEDDIFVLRLDVVTGTYLWAANIGGSTYDEGRSIVADDSGYLYTVGYFTVKNDMDPSGCVLELDPEPNGLNYYLLKIGVSTSGCMTIDTQPQSQVTCVDATGAFTVLASGTTNIQYQWEFLDGEGNYAGDVPNNARYSGANTGTLSINTSGMSGVYRYRARITGDGYPGTWSNPVELTISPGPAVEAFNRCGPGVVTLKASGAAAGEYRWYTQPTGGSPIAGETSDTYTTTLAVTTTFYVSRMLPSCETGRTPIVANVRTGCIPPPELVWGITYGSGGWVSDVVLDNNANAFVLGYFTGTADFDPGAGVATLTSTGHYEPYVARYNAAGEYVWAKRFGGNQQDNPGNIKLDPSGNIIVTAAIRGTADLDPGPGTFNVTAAGGFDVVIIKLDPDGNFIWGKIIGGSPFQGDTPTGLETDASGNVFVSLSFYGSVDMDPNAGTSFLTSGGNSDGAILKLDPNGNFQRVTHLRGSSFDIMGGIKLDANGNLFVTGAFYTNTDFDPTAGTNIAAGSADQNAFLWKLDVNGNLVWYKTWGVANNIERTHELDIDNTGNLIVSGYFRGTMDADPGAGVHNLVSVGSGDGFVIKLDALGNYIWSQSFGSTEDDTFQAITRNNDVYLCGTFYKTVDFDPGSGIFEMTSAGASEDFISMLNSNGDFQWAIKTGGPGADTPTAIRFDNGGNIYFGGYLNSQGDFDPGPGILTLAAGSSYASFLVKLGAPVPVLQVTSPPSTTSACSGAIATFNVAATGTTNIKYRWQKFDTPLATYVDLTDGGGYSGTATATLSINTTGNFGAGDYRARISGDGAADIYSNAATLNLVLSLTAPAVNGATRCGTGSLLLTATGGSAGNYRWYTASTGGAITGEVNDTYTTPSVSATTTYYVSIVSGSCESAKTPVTATVNAIPSAPVVVGSTICTTATGASITVTTPAYSDYRLYDVASGGTPLAMGAGNFSIAAPAFTTTYFVSSVDNTCESGRTSVTVTVTDCTNNKPPVITTTSPTAAIEGNVTINLTSAISDPDNNINLASLRIVTQPKSGAKATIDQNGQLKIDYAGVAFAGEDEITIEVCDIANSCVQQTITIHVEGDMEIFNAVSPNGDGKNDALIFQYIDLLESTRENRVRIYNRWGDLVYEVENYNNTSNVFTGTSKGGGELPSGTYFFKIEFTGGRPSETGYFSLKR